MFDQISTLFNPFLVSIFQGLKKAKLKVLTVDIKFPEAPFKRCLCLYVHMCELVEDLAKKLLNKASGLQKCCLVKRTCAQSLYSSVLYQLKLL